MSTISKSFLGLAALAGLLSAAPASAALDEMIVSSERRDASLQDVPIAVTALDADKLEEFQIYQASDLQRYVPSLNMYNNVTSPTNLSPSLRGGLQQDASLVTAESPFGIYVDDIYVGRLNGNNVTMSDIERVEVLRGPQGTLYGRNTAYGAIRFLSRTPGDEFWLNGSAAAGNYEQMRVNGSVGGPLSDSWAGSLAAQYATKDEQFTNVWNGEKTGLNENTSVRGKLRYTGSDTFDAVLSVSYSDSKNDSNQMPKGITPNVQSNCNFPNPPCTSTNNAQFRTSDIVWLNGEYNVNTPNGAFPLPDTSVATSLIPGPLGSKPKGETKQSITGLTLSWDINERMTLKSITGYVGLEDYFHTDFSGNTGDTTLVNGFPRQVYGFTGATDVDSDQFSQEFQLLGTVGDRINYIAGVYYLDEDADQQFGWSAYNLADFTVFPPTYVPGFIPVSQSDLSTSIKSISAFGEASMTFFDQLTLTAGLRYTEDDKDFNAAFHSYLVAPGDPPATTLVPLSGKYDEWTPKFAIDYALNTGGVVDSMLLYGSAARGFKGGGFSAIAIFSPSDFAVYGPETNWTYEAGMKAEWFGSSLRTNIAYFFSDIEDIQQNATVDLPGGGVGFPVQNSGDAEIQGLEYEIVWNPLDGLNLFLTGNFLDGEFKNLNPGSAAGQAEGLYGVKAVPPQVADYTYTIGFDYSFDMTDQFGASFGADYYKTDDYVSSATNDFYNDGWDLINAFVGVSIGENWDVRLSGKNLADDTVVVSGSRSLGGFVYLPPREYLLQVSYKMQ